MVILMSVCGRGMRCSTRIFAATHHEVGGKL